MLVNATNMLLKARDGHYAVGQFNINNLEWTKSILLTAQEMNSPVILGVSEGAGKYMTGFKTVAAMVKAMDESLGITVPVALHLDHGSYEGAKACVAAGFTSIMFDGSHYAIEENVAKTTELVALAHDHGLSIEAEVGSIGGEEDGVVGMGEVADPAECAKIAALGIDFLAAGIGNIHGKYPANWKGLDFEALDRIHAATDNIPLVLHGGTGIPAEMIKKAISLGVSKINVNTECQLSFADATRKYIEAGKDLQGKGFDPRKLLAPGAEAIKATVREKIELFGSANKALFFSCLNKNKHRPQTVADCHRLRAFVLLKFVPMPLKKLPCCLYILQFRPLPCCDGFGIQIIHPRPRHGQQKRRVCRYDKLAVVKPRRIMQKLRQLQLPFGRKAVFRLIQQIQCILTDAFAEHSQCALPVGAGAHIGRQCAARHLGLAVSPRGAYLLEPVVVLHAVHLEFFPPKFVVIRKHLLTARVHAIVQRPQIEHIVKHIITCQDHAARGYGARSPRLAQACIIVKKRRAIILCAAVKPQGIGHYI